MGVVPFADYEEQSMSNDTGAPAKTKKLPTTTRPTGQKRSLERGKSTRKKNPGKRPHKGG
jgi:hypothetical protein